MITQPSHPVDGRFYPELGVWIRVTKTFPDSARPALFLDRDGVIIEDPGYLSNASNLVLIPGAAEVIAWANRSGIPVVVITNQAGIARRYFGWNEFSQVQGAVERELATAGAIVDGVFACPYHHDGQPPWNHPDHPARKPRPGMLLAAKEFMNLDLRRSWIVGDKLDDLLAGHNAELRGGLHVLTGDGLAQRPAIHAWKASGFDVRLGDSISDAIALFNSL
jgi:D-glycero-D-manno-heptose 1,7-bisphosphate phosphatase